MAANTPLIVWLLAAASLLLWLLLARAEWKRVTRGRALLRSLLLLGAIVALFLVWLRPTHSRAGGDTTILLNGSAPALLDSLLQAYPAARVWSLQPHPDHPRLEGISYLPQHVPAGSSLFLVGEGLSPADLQYLKPYSFTYLPAALPEGVLRLRYRERLTPHDSLLVEGRWRPASGEDRLLLSQGAVVLDSVRAGKTDIFALQAPIRLAGRQLMQLHWLGQRGDTLASYHLPLQVAAAGRLQLALLTAYPEPESRQLKDYLRQQGYAIYYAAQLAPGKQVEEWINLPRQPLRLNQAGLAGYDVLILSYGYWSGLGRSQQQEIYQAVARQGLGLILYPDADSRSLRWQAHRLQLAQEPGTDSLLGAGQRLPITHYRFEGGTHSWEKLLQGIRSGPIALLRREGRGMLAVSSSPYSHRLQLQGRSEGYQAYWHGLLSAVLPPAPQAPHLWQKAEGSERQALQLRLYSSDSLPTFELLAAGQQPLPSLRWQVPGRKGLWEIRAWPSEAGWYQAQSTGDTLMVAVAEAPGSVQRWAWQQASRQAASAQQQAAPTRFRQEPIPAGWFYVLFLISMGGLWLERKLRG
ncbi:hypothetical protein [Cesiribacter andamanensis]|uniref:Uncharacterized protein n=1 Tax=Cesiribacter andamanensis AMV16 TaxID=1279009 RepID=M7NSC6_9BACT|nr:hypothetical protein [Cesiribacter andamanensis]EMR01374.1 hypothetical protein ADICEAN_03507 [Cesiribacter andamanensis AMV16]